MRIRLQLLLPLVVGIVVGAGFLLAALTTADAVRGALSTVAGLTRERAVEAAVRVVTLGGVLATALAMGASALLARAVIRPLKRIEGAARLSEDASPDDAMTAIAEIRDVAQGVGRAARELRERHERAARESSELAMLVNTVSEGIVQVGRDGRIERTNPASRRLMGLSDHPVGRPIGSLFRSHEIRDVVDRGVAGEIVSAVEVALDERRVLVSVSPRQAGGAVATFVDLTDLRRLEEVRRDFVANASHELKTPLTSIRGYSETLLHDDLPDSERRQFLETIARNAGRLQRIVDDLLDLSRLESGRWKPRLESVDVARAVQESWGPFADGPVRFTIHDDTTAPALADRHALEQVLANLFDNAVRYVPEGGSVDVRAYMAEAGSPPPDFAASSPWGGGRTAGSAPAGSPPGAPKWVVVEVADTGSGIPRDALPRIFERFYRVDPARSRAEGGTGLGLSIVKHLIESMGGGVQAESALGRGTVIRLWLAPASS